MIHVPHRILMLLLLSADEVDILGYGSSEEDQGSNSGSSSVDGATTCARNLAITDHDDDL